MPPEKREKWGIMTHSKLMQMKANLNGSFRGIGDNRIKVEMELELERVYLPIFNTLVKRK